jgi:glyoxylase-like metal-dependent hydrolase (beta-lactamase superfamily II)
MPLFKLTQAILPLCIIASTLSWPVSGETDQSTQTQKAAPPAVTPILDKKQAGFYRMKLGKVDLIALSDGSMHFSVAGITVNDKPGEVDRLLASQYETSPTNLSFNAYLIHLGTRWILIDAGSSDLVGPTVGKLPDSLRAAGVRPEEVSDIFITHLHPDHVGGITADKKKVFPNATIHVNKNESDFWLNKEQEAKSPDTIKMFFKPAQDSVRPYAETGKLETFVDTVEFFPGLRSQPAYGHTPGHTFYVLEDGGQKIVFIGDMIHIPSAQFDNPEIAMNFDYDSKNAVKVRQQLLADAAKNSYQIAGAHLPFPGAGHVRQEGSHFRWIPVAYINDAVEK